MQGLSKVYSISVVETIKWKKKVSLKMSVLIMS